jgi:Fibrinogen beta and gamma chains, C-terminal globular domain
VSTDAFWGFVPSVKRLLALFSLFAIQSCTGCGPQPVDRCAAVTCTAASQCHDVGTCDPSTGQCTEPLKTDGASCSDGNACTQADICQSGACVAGSSRTCTASDQCHEVGTCDPMTGACSNPAKANDAPCSDGNACTQTDTCQSGACVGASPRTCTASDQCHEVGTCDPMTGACSNPAKANDAPCSDGNACTQTDTCQSGACVGASPRTCTASDQCHQVGTCDPMTGACSNPAKANDAPCSDGNACTQTDTCQAGACVGASPRTCTASDQCHQVGSCDPQTGACSNPQLANDAACDDANACTLTDTCLSGVCVGGAPKVCTGTQCTDAGTCDPQTGACGSSPVADGTACDDGTLDTLADVCAAGVCTGGAFASSCRDLQDRLPPGTVSTGVHVISGADGGVPVWCEAGADDGGWTGIFIGRNGSPNVFDHFDTGSHLGTFVDPTQRYLQRAPVAAHDGFGELAVQCGAAFVSFPWTEQSADYFLYGIQRAWLPLTPRVVSGTVGNVPNTLFTGNSPDRGFIFSLNQAAFGSTFASSYLGNSNFDRCNGVADTTTIARVFYREAPRPVSKNTPQDARATCRAILNAAESQGSGYYYLRAGSNPAYLAYCDMTTAGGGWTALLASLNGSSNVFSSFDASPFTEVCTDPGRRCVRRAPQSLSDAAGEISASCGTATVSFALTEALRTYLQSGTQFGWLNVEPTVLTGTVAAPPNTVWTGNGADRSLVLARNQAAFGSTFASLYPNGNYDYCNGTLDRASPWKLSFREVDPEPVRNTVGTALRDCGALRDAGFTLSGRYYITDGAGAPYLAACDMTTAGGGWTIVNAGRNGSVNTFDRFDAPGYVGTCPDPASRCVRRAPVELGDTQSELLSRCGTAAVSFPTTRPLYRYLSQGAYSNWQAVTATVQAGTVNNVPNTFYAGNGSTAPGFIIARNQAAFASTFASAFVPDPNFDYCNGIADRTSFSRLGYRRLAQPPERNTVATAGLNCFELRSAGATQDGLYWITEGAGSPYLAYCDMTTDGGGWTAIFAGRNGTTNVVDHFDAPIGTGACPDPALRCQRRLPSAALAPSNDLMVKCGSAAVKLDATNVLRAYLSAGVQGDWTAVTPTVLTGTVNNVPNTFFTGSAANNGFIFARNQAAFTSTFASSFLGNANFDYCNGIADQASMVTVSYRRVAPDLVRNTSASARATCRAVFDAGESTGDGLYYVTEGTTPHLKYCDMTTGGGGWTAMFTGRNGSVHTFDAFDNGAYGGSCPDPSTRCLQRAPAALSNPGGKIAVSCRGAMVEFPATAAVANYFVSGSAQNWLAITPTVLTGTVANVPNTLWTGDGAANRGFIFALNQGAFTATFASSYALSPNYSYCNNVADASSPMRVYYREGP